MKAAVCLGLCAALSFGAEALPAQSPITTGSVNGVVRLGDTGGAASGVNVFLLGPESFGPPLPAQAEGQTEIIVRDAPSATEIHVAADANGEFAFAGVSPGVHYVTAYKDGYISPFEFESMGGLSSRAKDGTVNVPSMVQKIVVVAGQNSHVALQVERGGTIEGRVMFSDGRPGYVGRTRTMPVEGYAVNAMVKGEDGEWRRALGAVHTDSSGHYRMAAVPPGSYIVFTPLDMTMVQTTRGSQAQGGPMIFAGDTVRPSKARVIQVSGTVTVSGVDITAPTEGLHTVRGRVEMPDGAPITKGIVRLFPTGEKELSRAGPLGVDGGFAFDRVENGDYTVSIEDTRESEFLGLAADGKGLRMRLTKLAFRTTTQDVSVSNGDPAAIVLRPTSVP